MSSRVIVWGENVHEQTNKVVSDLYPKGMHGAVANVLIADGIIATTATLQEPEH